MFSIVKNRARNDFESELRKASTDVNVKNAHFFIFNVYKSSTFVCAMVEWLERVGHGAEGRRKA